MKGKRFFVLASAAALALLFAGCGQQPTGGGQEPPKPIQLSMDLVPGSDLSGLKNIKVSINEDSQVQELALYVDGELVSKYTISSQAVRPQALTYEFKLNTAACDRAKLVTSDTGCSLSNPNPLFRNGPHTIKAVAKNALGTRELAVEVNFDNQDLIAFTLSGNNATDPNGDTWYGNGDVTVNATIVNYTGATYTFQKVSGNSWKIARSGGTGSSASFLPDGNQTISGATLSSASGTSLVFAKGENDGVEATVSYYSALAGYLLGTQPTLRIDNGKPTGLAASALGLLRTYEETPTPGATEANQKTRIAYTGSATDGGVDLDKASFKVTLEYGIPAQTVVKSAGNDLSDIPTAVTSITVKKLAISDKLGNTAEFTPSSLALTFDNTAPSLSIVSAPTSVVAGSAYYIDYSASDGGSGLLPTDPVKLYLVVGGKNYQVEVDDAASSPDTISWAEALKLGDGASTPTQLLLVAFDEAGNTKAVTLNLTVTASNAADQQAPTVNSLTASGALKAGSATPTATLTAKASEKPTHSSGAVTFVSFYREHSNPNLTGYFVPVNVSSSSGGSAEDTATSASISGSNYPNPGTFGTAVLVRDASHNAQLGTGTLTVNP